MSQISKLNDNLRPLPPDIPDQFITDSGTAIPLSNQLFVLGITTAAAGIPFQFTAPGSTNIVRGEIQLASAVGATSTTAPGLASFNSSEFTVDANGFVSLVGGGAGIDSVALDYGISPIVPNGSGQIALSGAIVTAGTNPVRTHGTGASAASIEVQISSAQASTDVTRNGLAHFDSGSFSVDANGFVTLKGGTEAIDSIGVDATSGGGTNPVLPTVGGLVTVNGATVAAGTNPIRTVSTAANVYQIQNQISQAIASTDATKIGLSNFDSARFTVDANGFVSANGSGIGETITGDSGGSLNPSSGNWNILGRSGSKTSGSGSTLTVNSPPFSQVGASATSSLNTGEFVTGAFTRTLPATAGLLDGDLVIYYCTSASALVITANTGQTIRIGSLVSSSGGTATSTAIGDSVSLRFDATAVSWMAVSAIGTWVMA